MKYAQINHHYMTPISPRAHLHSQRGIMATISNYLETYNQIKEEKVPSYRAPVRNYIFGSRPYHYKERPPLVNKLPHAEGIFG
ncbi:MAG: hypothetical protein KBB55_03640 [Candidatus Buchananbacteria bacterium]|nr:hypothetical protein [Candidatus Buchananbacteria bacterium]